MTPSIRMLAAAQGTRTGRSSPPIAVSRDFWLGPPEMRDGRTVEVAASAEQTGSRFAATIGAFSNICVVSAFEDSEKIPNCRRAAMHTANRKEKLAFRQRI